MIVEKPSQQSYSAIETNCIIAVYFQLDIFSKLTFQRIISAEAKYNEL